MEKYKGKIKPGTTDVITKMSAASIWVKIKKISLIFLGAAFLGLIIWGIGYGFEVNWLKIAGYAAGGLIAVFGVYSGATAQVANCPYCGGLLGVGEDDDLSLSDENNQLECTHCYEWLTSNKGEVKAFKLSDLSEKDEYDKKVQFDAPLFKNGVWPDECIVCGSPATVYQQAKKTKVELTKLLVGKLSVQNTSIKNIPYCAKHSDAVSITIKSEIPRLVFSDYESRRRYVSLNKDKKPLK